MSCRPLLVVGGLFAIIALVIVLASCGSGGTGGPNPGGGSSGGPSFDFSFPSTGTSRAFAFADSGAWDYQCSPHGGCCGMKGVVIVSSLATAESALVQVGPSNDLRFSPDTVRIKPGRTVRWVNVSSASNHTVTR